MAKWMVSAKKADFDGIGKRFGIDPVIARPMFSPVYAEAAKGREMLTVSRYFIMEVPTESILFFAWRSSAETSLISMNVILEKFCRQ